MSYPAAAGQDINLLLQSVAGNVAALLNSNKRPRLWSRCDSVRKWQSCPKWPSQTISPLTSDMRVRKHSVISTSFQQIFVWLFKPSHPLCSHISSTSSLIIHRFVRRKPEPTRAARARRLLCLRPRVLMWSEGWKGWRRKINSCHRLITASDSFKSAWLGGDVNTRWRQEGNYTFN